jgi:endoglucanase
VDCCNAADQALMAGALDLAAAERARLGYPVYVGAFGAYGKAPQAARLRYLRFMREGMERRGLPGPTGNWPPVSACTTRRRMPFVPT